VTTELILRSKPLALADLEVVLKLGRVENDAFVLERSLKGYKLKTPTSVPLARLLDVGQRGLVEYIIFSLASERPRLVPFVLENQSLIELARYFLRYRTGSAKTLYVNVDAIARYAQRLGISPDALVSDVKTNAGLVDMAKIPKHVRALEDFVGELQDRGLAPSRTANYVKAVRSLYRVNGVDVKLPYSLSRRSVRKDRAPKPEELQRLLDVGDLREKVMVSMLALGGFREGTLVRLRYSHVKEDLEKGIIPAHVHVEAEITKGKYHDYDTFLGAEAVEALKLYLNARRKGLLDRRIPREEMADDSPLLRDHQRAEVRTIGERQLYKLIHSLYSRVGLLRAGQNGGYDLRVHSIRKFFKTQLMALGVQADYVDYMMGHTVDTYHDIQSKGIEFLRNVYATAGLSIMPKPKGWELDALKAFARGLGLEPEKVLTQAALTEPHRTYATPEDREQAQTRALSIAIKELIKKELLASEELPSPTNSHSQA
jgi:site-specific recombinase XerD